MPLPLARRCLNIRMMVFVGPLLTPSGVVDPVAGRGELDGDGGARQGSSHKVLSIGSQPSAASGSATPNRKRSPRSSAVGFPSKSRGIRSSQIPTMVGICRGGLKTGRLRGWVAEQLTLLHVPPRDLGAVMARLHHDERELGAAAGGTGRKAGPQGMPGVFRRIEPDPFCGAFNDLCNRLAAETGAGMATVERAKHGSRVNALGLEPGLNGRDRQVALRPPGECRFAVRGRLDRSWIAGS